MYGIIHKEIFNSTLMAEGYEVAYLMMAFITLGEKDDCVRMAPSALASRINMPLEKVERGISRLEKEEPDSDSPDFGGRRIVPIREIDGLDGNRGWFVVNREKYIQLAKKENRSNTNKKYYESKMTEKSELSENEEIKTENVLNVPDSDECKTHIDIDVDVSKEGANAPPDNPKDIVWQEGVKLGIDRNFLGKLCKEYTTACVAQAVLKTKEQCPADPTSYLIGILKSASPDFEKGAI